MAELVPHSFAKLVTRLLAEPVRAGTLFDLPARKFFGGDPAHDLSVPLHGRRAATPLGPAAGPHTQLAQNIVLGFLGGARVFELKTVQINDRLTIPRPCIDAATIGYNVEWSQELTLEQSLEEYVKASMLIEILGASGLHVLPPGAGRAIFDLSVGYDLAGIQSERVRAFLRGMLDAGAVVDRLRDQIPDEHRGFRELDFNTKISDSLTLSTFHGCPPDEIERMVAWLLEEMGLHCVVKLNPTLLGAAEARRLLNDRLGYPDRIPDEAFAKDATWTQAIDFVGRLSDAAARLGRGFGVKFSNTLIVENHRTFFPPSEKVMYLSGQPLHVLAMNLVARFRAELGDRIPVSFSAGIDRKNFADAVSLGLVPVTVCTDLLRTGGYGRLSAYLADLGQRMAAVGARTVDEWIVLAQGHAEAALTQAVPDPDTLASGRRALAERGDLAAAVGAEPLARWLGAARLMNTRSYVAGLADDPRYAHAANTKTPPKLGSRLELFDCVTCDKCVPVCPNDANFTYTLPRVEVPIATLRPRPDGSFAVAQTGTLRIAKAHQLATFADSCNECGNCDVFCPEDGGPYVLKPRFFGSHAEWLRFPGHDGFALLRSGGADHVWGRFGGHAYALSVEDARMTYSGDGFELHGPVADVSAFGGRATRDVDLTYLHIMNLLRVALLGGDDVTWVA